MLDHKTGIYLLMWCNNEQNGGSGVSAFGDDGVEFGKSKRSEVQLPSVPPQADRLPLDCPLQPISTSESAPEYL